MWTLLVEYFSTEVSDASEVPRFIRDFLFGFFKEVKLVFVCSIITCLRVQVVASREH